MAPQEPPEHANATQSIYNKHDRLSYGKYYSWGVSGPPLQEICSVHRMLNYLWHLLSTLILRLECVIEEITECPVYMPYCFKYICEFIRGSSPSPIWSLLGLGFVRVEGRKGIGKWSVLFLPFFPALGERSSRLGWSIIGWRGMCMGCCSDVPFGKGWS